jgi:transposase-like protein
MRLEPSASIDGFFETGSCESPGTQLSCDKPIAGGRSLQLLAVRMQTITEPMDPSAQCCPNPACSARGQRGQGNIRIHCRQRQRYRCRTCGQTFSARRGTLFEGWRSPREVIVIVVTLLAFGCPVQAIVQAYGLDERTVASWRDRAGAQCQRVHQAIVEQAGLDLLHVQVDEIRGKARSRVAWMGLAMMVSTRLWLAGVVSQTRDTQLADRLLLQVHACCQAARELLICTNGWSAYPGSIRRAFRDKVKRTAGRGRASLQIWPGLHIGTVIKHTVNKRLREVVRHLSHGSLDQAQCLLQRSAGGQVLNTCITRAFQRDDARTARHFNSEMSPCCSAAASTRNGDVSGGQYLQLLLCPSSAGAAKTDPCYGE